MFDLLYDFFLNDLLGSSLSGAHFYLQELAIILTHVSMFLIYLLIVRLIIWTFDIFRGVAQW